MKLRTLVKKVKLQVKRKDLLWQFVKARKAQISDWRSTSIVLTPFVSEFLSDFQLSKEFFLFFSFFLSFFLVTRTEFIFTRVEISFQIFRRS